MAYTMTTGTGAPLPQFTPAPACQESFSHLYRTESHSWDERDGAAYTQLPDLKCGWYNLGPVSDWNEDGEEGCTPTTYTTRSNEMAPTYLGCPSGYTTACAGTGLAGRAPEWPSTAISAMCCPTHSVFSFSCGGSYSTRTAAPNPYYAFLDADAAMRSVYGCVAAVPAPTTTEVLSIETVGQETSRAPTGYMDGPWTVTQGALEGYIYHFAEATSTATLQPGVDHVSAPGVGIAMTVWGQSTCYAARGQCETPAPMYTGWHRRNEHKPWAPAGVGNNATGIASIVLLSIITIAFFMSILGFWVKGKDMHAKRRQLRLDLYAESRRQDRYYGQ